VGGLNVLFDPDYTSRPLNIELNGVTLYEALDLVAAESKTFWKPMTANTIFVATDNPAKRKELDENVIKTFYLSNLTAPTELQDLVNTQHQSSAPTRPRLSRHELSAAQSAAPSCNQD
jgi:general secretion pathway protein D